MNPKDIITNKCFCPMPWTGFMYNFDGKVKNCIRNPAEIGNIKEKSIEEIMSGSINLKTQELMLNFQPGQTCHLCYDLEKGLKSFDAISDRLFYIRELKKVPTDVYKQNNFSLNSIDVRWSNLCNFACVYCGPEFSSKWADATGVVHNTPTPEQKDRFKQYIFDHAKNLKHVYMAGGEPLLMRENLELLSVLDPDVNLRINTNLSKVDTNIFEQICKFKNVHWIISAESIEDEYEYIRYGGNWINFLENLNTIKNLPHKITFNMLHFLLNYKSLFVCIDYFKSIGFHNNSFVIGPLTSPDYLIVRHLPDEVLQSVITMLSDRVAECPGFLLENSYRNLLSYLQQPHNKDLSRSFSELQNLDQLRGLDSSKIFKDLYKLKGNYHGNY